jgi:hypothetical protein
MEAFLLSLHVLAGILFVGPVAVAISLFPRYAPIEGRPSRPPRAERNAAVALGLHRITRAYGTLAVIVPAIGILLASVQGRLGEIWIAVAMILTAVAGALLVLQIAPRQRDALSTPGSEKNLRHIGVLAGVFNLLWAVVVILMIVRPGSDYS